MEEKKFEIKQHGNEIWLDADDLTHEEMEAIVNNPYSQDGEGNETTDKKDYIEVVWDSYGCPNKCPECGSTNLDTVNHQWVCNQCSMNFMQWNRRSDDGENG